MNKKRKTLIALGISAVLVVGTTVTAFANVPYSLRWVTGHGWFDSNERTGNFVGANGSTSYNEVYPSFERTANGETKYYTKPACNGNFQGGVIYTYRPTSYHGDVRARIPNYTAFDNYSADAYNN